MTGGPAGLAEARVAIERESKIRAVRRVAGLIVDQFLLGGEEIIQRAGGRDFSRIEAIRWKDFLKKRFHPWTETASS
jgi:hypothetical protein